MKNADKYKVYCHINKINNKRYYGITMQDINRRWSNGRTYKPKNENHNSRFYNAILKYGWDNFEHIILCDNLNKKEAEDLEIKFIKEYDTTNPEKGYNIQSGGNSKGRNTDEIRKRISEGRKKKVLQIDKKDYSVIKIWDSGEDASISLNIAHANISKCISGERMSAGGYIWRFEKDYSNAEAIDELISKEIKEFKDTHKRKISLNTLKKAHEATSKKVAQINKETGEVIAHYNSISEASRITDIGISNISRVCLRERGSAGGYVWKFSES